MLVDGDGSQYGGLSARLESYLSRYYEGQSITNVKAASQSSKFTRKFLTQQTLCCTQ